MQTERGERSQVEDSTAKLSFLNDRLVVTSRVANSYYEADDKFLQRIARKSRDGSKLTKARFLGRGKLGGNARSDKVNFVLLDNPHSNISFFGYRSEVDYYFETLALENRKDEFFIRNRRSKKAGARASAGPLSVDLTASGYAQIEGAAPSEEHARDFLVTLDVTEIRDGMGEGFTTPAWSVFPSSLWVGNSTLLTQRRRGETGAPDSTFGSHVGASWDWDSGNASVGYWDYFFDSELAGAEEYDWAGRGVDASLGFYGASWTTDLSLSYSRSLNLETLTRSDETTYDAGLYGSFTPEGLPSLQGGISAGYYIGEYYGDASVYEGYYWTITAGIDFTRIIWRPRSLGLTKLNEEFPMLKLYYRQDGEIDATAYVTDIDHTVAFTFKTMF